MINKYQLPMSLTLKAKPVKEKHVKCARDGKIIAPSVAGNNEDMSKFQRINREAIKIWFKSKQSGFNKSKCSRTMLGFHVNEKKITRSIEVELKQKFEVDEFEL